MTNVKLMIFSFLLYFLKSYCSLIYIFDFNLKNADSEIRKWTYLCLPLAGPVVVVEVYEIFYDAYKAKESWVERINCISGFVFW